MSPISKAYQSLFWKFEPPIHKMKSNNRYFSRDALRKFGLIKIHRENMEIAHGCQTCDYIPRSWEFLENLSYFPCLFTFFQASPPQNKCSKQVHMTTYFKKGYFSKKCVAQNIFQISNSPDSNSVIRASIAVLYFAHT